MRATRAEVNISAFNYNIKKIKEVSGVKICAVLKANAYGHGLSAMANNAHSIDMIAVATVGEGIQLRKNGTHIPILVMSPFSRQEVPLFYDYNLIPFMTHMEHVDSFMEYYNDKPLPIHIKVDTGMNRVGFNMDELENVVKELLLYPCFKIEGIGTHFSSSGSCETTTKKQIENFNNAVDLATRITGCQLVTHASNTEGIFNYPEANYDMVRPGIGLYGFPSGLGLKPVLTLKSKVVLSKYITKGSLVSYDASWTCPEDTYISIIPVGYGDGLPRNYQGKVKIKDEYYPIVGRVCMDMLMISTGAKKLPLDIDVLIFGDDPELTIYNIAKQCDTIPGEILTHLSQRVPLIYF